MPGRAKFKDQGILVQDSSPAALTEKEVVFDSIKLRAPNLI